MLTSTREIGDYFSGVVQGSLRAGEAIEQADFKLCANWVINELFGRLNKEGKEQRFEFASNLEKDVPVKSVAFAAPLVLEIIDPTAAKDSFSEIKVKLTTSGGATAEVVCPLSLNFMAKQKKQNETALDYSRFVGHIILALGDKDSPNTTSLDPWDLRLTAQIYRAVPFQKGDSLADNVVPVLNLSGRDVITATYKRTTTSPVIPAAETKDHNLTRKINHPTKSSNCWPIYYQKF